MRMGQGVRTGSGHGGITCVLQTQFSSFLHPIFTKKNNVCDSLFAFLGMVVQSFVRLSSSFRGHLVKCFMTYNQLH